MLLRAFVQVSEVGSISRAAPALGYTQPGLSQRIQSLERHLGCRLFDRGPYGVALTRRGEAVLPYARIMIGVADALVVEARRCAQPTQPSISRRTVAAQRPGDRPTGPG